MSKRNLMSWIPYLFVMPAVLYMLALVGYPLVNNFILSFKEATITNLTTGKDAFIGFGNYAKIFHDDIFWITLKNSFLFTIGSVLFQFVFGFLLALFFSLNFRLASFIRGLMMVGWLIPITISALLFRFMMDSNVGILNHLLLMFGFVDQPLDWLINPHMALWAVVIANIWIGIPFNMLLLSTGLTSLPTDVYESASLDGANWFQKFTRITIPLLRPVIMIVMMLGFIYTFKVFDLIYVMTGGGPVNATEVLSMLAYRYSFTQFNFGLGSAVANILFIILFLISLFYLKMIRNDEVI
jgi:multiple sugar transport system permease protein